ncbi:LacI family DNA-binding transcriptional regulator [Prosthecomicrobium pneumaticum]|uniref:DNA-binding LacI/PurR family transcriptional regulator n=1 Tax=Prosthecomicrobium pneumaticum TaxID=81895 RepID=A0A7W9FQW7_9HYPH|nr:LacI family DNA-binding transcriptional regulator [Prosthecomicrobium pneumaticum]MBB5755175.1 DNA-binding LacI/PurR family transcriptional regulator [Prosthecomicrobium pneumaticum]
MTTLKDVAALAGVSTATASLALNGGPVNEKTRETVKKAAKQLNYVPNKVGQMLTSGRSNTIELIILTADEFPNIVRKTSLFYYLMEGVLAIADQRNVSVRFAVKSYDDPGLVTYFAELVGSRMVDGAIVIPQFARDARYARPLQDAGFPFVLLRAATFGDDLNYVDMGNSHGAKLVADLLVGCGAQRVGIINGPASHLDAIEREQGFTAALLDGGAALVAKLNGDFTIESGYAAMDRIAARKLPDAVFCANDYMAAGAIKFLRGRGIRVPDDIAIVGYDNNDIATAVDPELTTVDNRFFDLGRELAGNLLSLIDQVTDKVAVQVTPELVIRQSCPAP